MSQEAADMILLTDDFSAIVMGIEEGRCIYPRLRSYVLYRISATIQIVTVLSTLVFAYDIVIPAFYVILLALLKDITMLTVSYDNVTPSRSQYPTTMSLQAYPEEPTLSAIFVRSFVVGAVMALSSIGFYILGYETAGEVFSHKFRDGGSYVDACIYLQISLGIQMMIFNCRNPHTWFWEGNPPNWRLIVAVIFANGLVTILCLFGWVVDTIAWKDVLIIIGYDIAMFFLVDAFKVLAGKVVNSERFEDNVIPLCGGPSTAISDADEPERGFANGLSPDMWSRFGLELNTWMKQRTPTVPQQCCTSSRRETRPLSNNEPLRNVRDLQPSFVRDSISVA